MTHVTSLECLKCGTEYPNKHHFEGCPKCRTENFVSNVAPKYDMTTLKKELDPSDFSNREKGIWRFNDLLPVDEEHVISLGEGNTPLIECPKFSEEWNIKKLYLKDESQNPTWSFKDRLASVAVSKGKELGAEVVIIASTGNHGAATAAYSNRAGLDCVIFTVPEVSSTMKKFMQSYGAKVMVIPDYEGRWKLMKDCINQFEWYPTGNHSYPPVGSNHYGIEGYKTIAYEIAESLDWDVPDWIVQPTALGDGLLGIWRGFKDLKNLNFIDDLPKMAAVEPFGPLKNALEKDLDHIEPIEKEETSAFSIGAGISTYQGLFVLKESGGTSVLFDEDELRKTQLKLAKKTGVYSEAASVAAFTGIQKLKKQGIIGPNDTVIAMNTSSGLKDPDMTAESLPEVPVIEPDLKQVKKTLQDTYDFSIN